MSITEMTAISVSLEKLTTSVKQDYFTLSIISLSLAILSQMSVSKSPDTSPCMQLGPADLSQMLPSDEGGLIQEYCESRLEVQDVQKAARDIIRTNGVAVRYGFSRPFKELTVGKDQSGERSSIWGTVMPELPTIILKFKILPVSLSFRNLRAF